MSTAAQPGTTTYLPEHEAEIINLVAALEARGRQVPTPVPALVYGEARLDLPPEIFQVLTHVATAMARGEGVTVVPRDAQLTTQQAADVLGMSRPTFVKLLEQDRMPYEKVGRHRRVRLQDVVEFQDRSRRARSEALDALAASTTLEEIELTARGDITTR